MIKIEIGKDYGLVEVEGKDDDVIIEAGFALYDCIGILRDCRMCDKFIAAMFKIALEHEGKDDD